VREIDTSRQKCDREEKCGDSSRMNGSRMSSRARQERRDEGRRAEGEGESIIYRGVAFGTSQFGEANIEFNEFCGTPPITR